MKNLKIGIIILSIFAFYQCSSSKVISTNADLVVISATKTNSSVNNIPGAQLDFTVVKTKNITLNSVLYWEGKHSLTILKSNKDTIWAMAEIKKPKFTMESLEKEESLNSTPYIDSSCVLIYQLDEKSLRLEIPKLKLLK